MSLHFVLDGYNIIKRNPSWQTQPLIQARQTLLESIVRERLCGSPRNKVTIVFDSRNTTPEKQVIGGIRMIFADRSYADEQILRLLEEAPNPKEMVVVTDDRELSCRARHRNARVIAVKEFIKPKTGSSRNRDKEDKFLAKTIEGVVASRITDELRRVWLKR